MTSDTLHDSVGNGLIPGGIGVKGVRGDKLCPVEFEEIVRGNEYRPFLLADELLGPLIPGEKEAEIVAGALRLEGMVKPHEDDKGVAVPLPQALMVALSAVR